MNTIKYLATTITLSITLLISLNCQANSQLVPVSIVIKSNKLFEDGNYKEAFDQCKKSLLETNNFSTAAMITAVNALQRLNRHTEVDSFISEVIMKYSNDWKCYKTAGEIYDNILMHSGYIQGGIFFRGRTRDYSSSINIKDHDHLHALKYMDIATQLINNSTASDKEKSDLYFTFAQMYTKDIYPNTAIRLLLKSDIDNIPPYTTPLVSSNLRGKGAPANPDGAPYFFLLPKNKAATKNDGELFRWYLHQSSIYSGNDLRETATIAELSETLYSVNTILNDFYNNSDISEYIDKLDKLGLNQTISRLESGIQLFTLPTPYNYLEQYIKLLNEHDRIEYSSKIASILENRRQYTEASKYWHQVLDSKLTSEREKEIATRHITQIVSGFIKFEASNIQSTTTSPELSLTFRNADTVSIKATAVDTDKLLADVVKSLKSNNVEPYKATSKIENLGWLLANNKEREYLEEEVYNSNIDLAKSAPHILHGEGRAKISLPKGLTGGAYFIEAGLSNGYKAYTLLWLNELAILSKPLIDNGQLYLTTDSSTGLSIPNIELSVFGYQSGQHLKPSNLSNFFVEAVIHTNKDGIAELPKSIIRPDFHYLVTAKSKDNRKAYIGFEYLDHSYNMHDTNIDRMLYITDKPLYRPAETIQISGWIRDYNYKKLETYPKDKHKEFRLTLYNPRGEKKETKKVQIQDNGKFAVDFITKPDATLGVWTIDSNLEIVQGGNYFRIEEYKKPEYTATITPNNLSPTFSDDITFTVYTEYNFGKPLQNAKVEYEIYKQPKVATYTPITEWDWLYGSGYQSRSRSAKPYSYTHNTFQPREEPVLVESSTLYTNSQGIATITLAPVPFEKDTQNQEFEYSLKATISDESNNFIKEDCSITVSKNSFSLSPDTDQNYYYTGETALVTFTPYSNNKAANINITSPATITVSRLNESLKDPIQITTKAIPQSPDHSFKFNFTPNEAGKYIIQCNATDKYDNLVSSKIEFYACVQDAPTQPSMPTDNALEVIAKSKSYSPGDTAELLIISKQPRTTLFVFSHTESELYTIPQTIQTTSNTNIINYKVKSTDTPNKFIEIINTSNEEVHTSTAELFIPPTTKILNLTITPEKEEYKPSSTAKVTVNIFNFNHTSFEGQGIIAVYDAALDEITGGTNSPTINDFFWGFVNSHYPSTLTSLNKYSYNIYADQTIPMQPIGIFGNFYNNNESLIPMLGRGNSLPRKGSSDAIFATSMKMSMVAESDAMPSPAATNDDISGARKDFSTTAVFISNLKFDNTGNMTIDIPLPDTLTRWKIKLWAITSKTEVAQAETSILTSKELMLIPSLPRFLVEGDTANINIAVYNNSAKDKEVTISLKTEAGIKTNSNLSKTFRLKADSQDNILWEITAINPIESSITVSAKSSGSSDTMVLPLTIITKGQQLFDSKTVLLGSNNVSHTSNINLPKNIKKEDSKLTVELYPDLTSLLINTSDNLPIEIPNTNNALISKLLPRLFIQNMLTDNQKMALTDTSIYKLENIKREYAKALNILAPLQHEDGGWSWIGKGRYCSAYITSLILQSLERADKLGIYIPAKLITGARLYLINYSKNRIQLINNQNPTNDKQKYYASNLDALIYSTLAQGGNENSQMRNFLFDNRLDLSVYGQSLLATGLYYNEHTKLLKQVLRNIEQYIKIDAENNTAYLNLQNSHFWWYWYGSESETIANYLNLRLLTGQDRIINEQLTHYLINNIKYISKNDSIQSTVSAFTALHSFIETNKSLPSTPEVEISLTDSNSKQIRTSNTGIIPSPQILKFSPKQLRAGNNLLKVSKTTNTNSPLYFTYTLSFYSLDEITKPHGLELKTERKYYRLIPEDQSIIIPDGKGSDKTLHRITYTPEELKSGDIIHAGDLIETELIVTSKNDYEYIYLKDYKPATLEPIESKSGYSYNGISYYVEYKNESVNYYIESLPRGSYSFKYRAYSLYSGTFTAKASESKGVFAPELNSNSSGFKFYVRD